MVLFPLIAATHCALLAAGRRCRVEWARLFFLRDTRLASVYLSFVHADVQSTPVPDFDHSGCDNAALTHAEEPNEIYHPLLRGSYISERYR
ncbi:hypothetical protein DFP73DRAFT_544082 [Morchella snyderi]|nr:hypothetical protein DFP73DRAFT_544082 [Morchella snyderi]